MIIKKMFFVYGIPETKKLDPVFWQLLINNPDLLSKSSFRGNKEPKDLELSQILEGVVIPKEDLSLLIEELRKPMAVIATEGKEPNGNTIFILQYTEIDLGKNKKGENKTPENLNGVFPDLVLTGIRKVYLPVGIEKGRDNLTYYFTGIPLRLAHFIERYIDMALRGEFLNYEPRMIDENIKGIIQKPIKKDYHIVVACSLEGILHSQKCPLYNENAFLFDLDKQTMDEIIAGKFYLAPGTYIGVDDKKPFIKQPKVLKIGICRKCCSYYLEPYGYYLKENI